VNYRALFAQSGLIGPLARSLLYGVITATVLGGYRLLAPPGWRRIGGAIRG
jgi:hypothetical protein